MTLLDDVISQASDGEATAVLRKLMIVAHRLGAASLLAWVKNELNGYEADDDLPSYRGPMTVGVQALITGPMGSRGTNVLTSHGIPEGFEGLFEVSFYDPLAGIEAFAQSSEGISIPWDPVIVGMYNRWIDARDVPFIQGWGVYSASKAVSQSRLRAIVDVVRTKALEMALDLQADFPEAGEPGGPTVDDPRVEATVTHITTNIYGSVTGLAQGNSVRQKVSVKAGDLVATLDAARAFLADSGVAEFSRVLTGPGDDEDKRGRLERFVHGVKSGTIAVAGGVASNLAAEGVIEISNQFFGWVANATG
ncbi:AbiTii domain-containing protein [Microbacterium sp.]|uniref:AbiTii domain-containing protein n=1 Tax=Microbacterium sp. TaxID=51671 RepID=UPI003F9D5C96